MQRVFGTRTRLSYLWSYIIGRTHFRIIYWNGCVRRRTTTERSNSTLNLDVQLCAPGEAVHSLSVKQMKRSCLCSFSRGGGTRTGRIIDLFCFCHRWFTMSSCSRWKSFTQKQPTPRAQRVPCLVPNRSWPSQERKPRYSYKHTTKNSFDLSLSLEVTKNTPYNSWLENMIWIW